MIDLAILSRWSSAARWLLSFFGACCIAIVLLLQSTDRTVVPGAKNVVDGWYRVGLFAPGNDLGLVDAATVRAVLEAPGVEGVVSWSTQRLEFTSKSGASSSGQFALVAPNYLQLIGLVPDTGVEQISEGPEVVLTAQGAKFFGLTANELPTQVKVNSKSFLIRSILPASYIGPSKGEPVLGLINQNWFRSLIFPQMAPAQVQLFPAYSMLVHAPLVDGPSGMTATLLANRIHSESPFLASRAKNSWVSFQGVSESPQKASAERLFRLVLLVISLLLFTTASLSYVVADSLSNVNLIRTLAVRSALGELTRDRFRWLLTSALSRAPLVAAITFAGAVILYQAYARSSDLDPALYASASNYAYAFIVSMLLALVPMLMSFMFNLIVNRSVSLNEGLNGHQSKLLYDAVAGKLLFASAVTLSAIFSASMVFFYSVSAFNSRPLGFDFDGVSQAAIVRQESSPASRESGIAEEKQLESLLKQNGLTGGVTNCAPLRSSDAVTNLDGAHSEVTTALICYATPGAIAALKLKFSSGENFTADDDSAAIVTTDFLSEVNGGGGIGATVLQEALGRPYRVSGIVEPVNLNATFGPSPPVVFLNGSEFGFRGTLLVQGTNSHLTEGIARDFGSDVLLSQSESVRKLVDASNADFLYQRSFALLASFACAALCSLTLIACCLLVLVARRQELGIRMAIGANDTAIFGWTFGGIAKPIVYGLVFGLSLSPILGMLLNQILPIAPSVVVRSIGVSACFCVVLVVVSIFVAVRLFSQVASISSLIRV